MKTNQNISLAIFTLLLIVYSNAYSLSSAKGLKGLDCSSKEGVAIFKTNLHSYPVKITLSHKSLEIYLKKDSFTKGYDLAEKLSSYTLKKKLDKRLSSTFASVKIFSMKDLIGLKEETDITTRCFDFVLKRKDINDKIAFDNHFLTFCYKDAIEALSWKSRFFSLKSCELLYSSENNLEYLTINSQLNNSELDLNKENKEIQYISSILKANNNLNNRLNSRKMVSESQISDNTTTTTPQAVVLTSEKIDIYEKIVKLSLYKLKQVKYSREEQRNIVLKEIEIANKEEHNKKSSSSTETTSTTAEDNSSILATLNNNIFSLDNEIKKIKSECELRQDIIKKLEERNREINNGAGLKGLLDTYNEISKKYEKTPNEVAEENKTNLIKASFPSDSKKEVKYSLCIDPLLINNFEAKSKEVCASIFKYPKEVRLFTECEQEKYFCMRCCTKQAEKVDMNLEEITSCLNICKDNITHLAKNIWPDSSKTDTISKNVVEEECESCNKSDSEANVTNIKDFTLKPSSETKDSDTSKNFSTTKTKLVDTECSKDLITKHHKSINQCLLDIQNANIFTTSQTYYIKSCVNEYISASEIKEINNIFNYNDKCVKSYIIFVNNKLYQDAKQRQVNCYNSIVKFPQNIIKSNCEETLSLNTSLNEEIEFDKLPKKQFEFYTDEFGKLKVKTMLADDKLTQIKSKKIIENGNIIEKYSPQKTIVKVIKSIKDDANNNSELNNLSQILKEVIVETKIIPGKTVYKDKKGKILKIIEDKLIEERDIKKVTNTEISVFDPVSQTNTIFKTSIKATNEEAKNILSTEDSFIQYDDNSEIKVIKEVNKPVCIIQKQGNIETILIDKPNIIEGGIVNKKTIKEEKLDELPSDAVNSEIELILKNADDIQIQRIMRYFNKMKAITIIKTLIPKNESDNKDTELSDKKQEIISQYVDGKLQFVRVELNKKEPFSVVNKYDKTVDKLTSESIKRDLVFYDDKGKKITIDKTNADEYIIPDEISKEYFYKNEELKSIKILSPGKKSVLVKINGNKEKYYDVKDNKEIDLSYQGEKLENGSLVIKKPDESITLSFDGVKQIKVPKLDNISNKVVEETTIQQLDGTSITSTSEVKSITLDDGSIIKQLPPFVIKKPNGDTIIRKESEIKIFDSTDTKSKDINNNINDTDNLESNLIRETETELSIKNLLGDVIITQPNGEKLIKQINGDILVVNPNSEKPVLIYTDTNYNSKLESSNLLSMISDDMEKKQENKLALNCHLFNKPLEFRNLIEYCFDTELILKKIESSIIRQELQLKQVCVEFETEEEVSYCKNNTTSQISKRNQLKQFYLKRKSRVDCDSLYNIYKNDSELTGIKNSIESIISKDDIFNKENLSEKDLSTLFASFQNKCLNQDNKITCAKELSACENTYKEDLVEYALMSQEESTTKFNNCLFKTISKLPFCCYILSNLEYVKEKTVGIICQDSIKYAKIKNKVISDKEKEALIDQTKIKIKDEIEKAIKDKDTSINNVSDKDTDVTTSQEEKTKIISKLLEKTDKIKEKKIDDLVKNSQEILETNEKALSGSSLEDSSKNTANNDKENYKGDNHDIIISSKNLIEDLIQLSGLINNKEIKTNKLQEIISKVDVVIISDDKIEPNEKENICYYSSKLVISNTLPIKDSDLSPCILNINKKISRVINNPDTDCYYLTLKVKDASKPLTVIDNQTCLKEIREIITNDLPVILQALIIKDTINQEIKLINDEKNKIIALKNKILCVSNENLLIKTKNEAFTCYSQYNTSSYNFTNKNIMVNCLNTLSTIDFNKITEYSYKEQTIVCDNKVIADNFNNNQICTSVLSVIKSHSFLAECSTITETITSSSSLPISSANSQSKESKDLDISKTFEYIKTIENTISLNNTYISDFSNYPKVEEIILNSIINSNSNIILLNTDSSMTSDSLSLIREYNNKLIVHSICNQITASLPEYVNISTCETKINSLFNAFQNSKENTLTTPSDTNIEIAEYFSSFIKEIKKFNELLTKQISSNVISEVLKETSASNKNSKETDSTASSNNLDLYNKLDDLLSIPTNFKTLIIIKKISEELIKLLPCIYKETIINGKTNNKLSSNNCSDSVYIEKVLLEEIDKKSNPNYYLTLPKICNEYTNLSLFKDFSIYVLESDFGINSDKCEEDFYYKYYAKATTKAKCSDLMKLDFIDFDEISCAIIERINKEYYIEAVSNKSKEDITKLYEALESSNSNNDIVSSVVKGINDYSFKTLVKFTYDSIISKLVTYETEILKILSEKENEALDKTRYLLINNVLFYKEDNKDFKSSSKKIIVKQYDLKSLALTISDSTNISNLEELIKEYQNIDLSNSKTDSKYDLTNRDYLNIYKALIINETSNGVKQLNSLKSSSSSKLSDINKEDLFDASNILGQIIRNFEIKNNLDSYNTSIQSQIKNISNIIKTLTESTSTLLSIFIPINNTYSNNVTDCATYGYIKYSNNNVDKLSCAKIKEFITNISEKDTLASLTSPFKKEEIISILEKDISDNLIKIQDINLLGVKEYLNNFCLSKYLELTKKDNKGSFAEVLKNAYNCKNKALEIFTTVKDLEASLLNSLKTITEVIQRYEDLKDEDKSKATEMKVIGSTTYNDITCVDYYYYKLNSSLKTKSCSTENDIYQFDTDRTNTSLETLAEKDIYTVAMMEKISEETVYQERIENEKNKLAFISKVFDNFKNYLGRGLKVSLKEEKQCTLLQSKYDDLMKEQTTNNKVKQSCDDVVITKKKVEKKCHEIGENILKSMENNCSDSLNKVYFANLEDFYFEVPCEKSKKKKAVINKIDNKLYTNADETKQKTSVTNSAGESKSNDDKNNKAICSESIKLNAYYTAEQCKSEIQSLLNPDIYKTCQFKVNVYKEDNTFKQLCINKTVLEDLMMIVFDKNLTNENKIYSNQCLKALEMYKENVLEVSQNEELGNQVSLCKDLLMTSTYIKDLHCNQKFSYYNVSNKLNDECEEYVIKNNDLIRVKKVCYPNLFNVNKQLCKGVCQDKLVSKTLKTSNIYNINNSSNSNTKCSEDVNSINLESPSNLISQNQLNYDSIDIVKSKQIISQFNDIINSSYNENDEDYYEFKKNLLNNKLSKHLKKEAIIKEQEKIKELEMMHKVKCDANSFNYKKTISDICSENVKTNKSEIYKCEKMVAKLTSSIEVNISDDNVLVSPLSTKCKEAFEMITNSYFFKRNHSVNYLSKDRLSKIYNNVDHQKMYFSNNCSSDKLEDFFNLDIIALPNTINSFDEEISIKG